MQRNLPSVKTRLILSLSINCQTFVLMINLLQFYLEKMVMTVIVTSLSFHSLKFTKRRKDPLTRQKKTQLLFLKCCRKKEILSCLLECVHLLLSTFLLPLGTLPSLLPKFPTSSLPSILSQYPSTIICLPWPRLYPTTTKCGILIFRTPCLHPHCSIILLLPRRQSLL